MWTLFVLMSLLVIFSVIEVCVIGSGRDEDFFKSYFLKGAIASIFLFFLMGPVEIIVEIWGYRFL